MAETIIGFVIWCITGLFFNALGIFSFVSKKPIGFWANAEMFQVTDIKNYNSAWILLSAGGVMIEVIVAMIVYITVIEKKYKKK